MKFIYGALLGAALACAVLVLLAMLLSVADAAEPNRKVTISWQAPTSCVDGSSITNCAVTGFEVQKLNGASWLPIGTTSPAILQFVESQLPLGQHSYRVIAQSDNGPSDPSNVATKVFSVPTAVQLRCKTSQK